MNISTCWSSDWQFTLDPDCGLTLPASPVWQSVQLPHDWQIWQVSDLYADGTGWYRKRFVHKKSHGQRYALYFEGVYQDMTLFVNGQAAGEWKYGYSSFHFDITDLLRDGDNEVLVRCVLRHPNSRWYSGAGIYRDVWLWSYPDTHLLPQSLYLSAKEGEQGCWTVYAGAEVGSCTDGADHAGYALKFTLHSPDFTLAETKTVSLADARPVEEETTALYARCERNIVENHVIFTLASPRLWTLEEPARYTVQVELVQDGQTRDLLWDRFGCRTVELFPDKGFYLNHEKLTLHGVCLHHDLGCLGAAFHPAAAERQLKLVQEMGANAIRTAHNMPAPAVLELCDKLGLLVVDEAFDCWYKGKNQYDYHRYFGDWHQRDMAAWIRRDRNHPSLILWSIGNEVYDTHQDERGVAVTRHLMEEVQRHDPLCNAAATFGSNYMAWENTQNCADLIKIVGYNYGEKLYEAHHAAHPDWVIYGSETASIIQSRGIYHFPLSQSLLVDDDLQCSSLGNSRTSWGAENVEACLAADVEHPYSLGQFLWSGFDYIGEPTPYHTKNAYLGQIDTAGFPKDAFYRWQAGWVDYRKRPMLHILPYWDFNEGQQIDIVVLSNAPEVELWVNGVSMGRKKLDTRVKTSAAWQVPYQRGAITAAAYDEMGNELLRTEERSFGDTAALRIESDRTLLTGDGQTLAFCTISAVDEAGNPVRNAADRVTVEVTGAATLVGLDNGDSADQDEYKTNHRNLFSGLLLAVIAGNPEGGEAIVTVSAPNVIPAQLKLTILPSQQERGMMGVPQCQPKEEIPVRKINLWAERQILTPDHPTAEVTAISHPLTNSYPDLTWRVTDEKGLTASGVTIEYLNEVKTKVRLTAQGDGVARVRCCCDNGRGFPRVISALELTVTGMGRLYPDPYCYLSAALYDVHGGEIGNGNERGIATSRTDRSWVAYQHLDFGRAGADTLDIDIFELASLPTPIRFWRGVPYAEGSVMVGERIYDKPSRWNVYQPETFTLDEVLRGVETLGIELNSKVHIKGFTFRRRSRAWDAIPAVTHDTIYGDSYQVGETMVTGIGNNVSLVFGDMDFGTQGCSRLTITGRSDIPNNTLHVIFRDEQGNELRRIVEFTYQPEAGAQHFTFAPVYGMQEVTFLFLPGSQFDFEQFQFGV